MNPENTVLGRQPSVVGTTNPQEAASHQSPAVGATNELQIPHFVRDDRNAISDKPSAISAIITYICAAAEGRPRRPTFRLDAQVFESRHSKGDLAEIAFLAKAISLGFTVCKPFSGNARFDFILTGGPVGKGSQEAGVRSQGRDRNIGKGSQEAGGRSRTQEAGSMTQGRGRRARKKTTPEGTSTPSRAKPARDGDPGGCATRSEDDNRSRVWKVQVKSSWEPLRGRRYQIRVGSGVNGRPRRYRADEVDFIVAYIVREDVWYVIPIGEIHTAHCIGVFPHDRKSRGRFEKYREAWQLLKESGK